MAPRAFARTEEMPGCRHVDITCRNMQKSPSGGSSRTAIWLSLFAHELCGGFDRDLCADKAQCGEDQAENEHGLISTGPVGNVTEQGGADGRAEGADACYVGVDAGVVLAVAEACLGDDGSFDGAGAVGDAVEEDAYEQYG